MLARVWLGDIPERDDHGKRGERWHCGQFRISTSPLYSESRVSALVTLLLSLTFSFLCRKRLIWAMGPREADVTISISHMQKPRSRDKISHPSSKGNWMAKL